MRIFVILVSFILGASSSYAASFNCDKASTLIENAICSDAELSNLDSLLGKAYRKSIKTASDANKLKKEQRKWISTKRNKCLNLNCLKDTYKIRIIELSENLVNEGDTSRNKEKIINAQIVKDKFGIKDAVAEYQILGVGNYSSVITLSDLLHYLVINEDTKNVSFKETGIWATYYQLNYDYVGAYNKTISYQLTLQLKYYSKTKNIFVEGGSTLDATPTLAISKMVENGKTYSYDLGKMIDAVKSNMVGELLFSAVRDTCTTSLGFRASTISSPPLKTDIPIVIDDNLDAQVAEFLRPPSEANSRGAWTVLGPVKGQYKKYIRAISREVDCRMGCDLLLLDYDTERPDVPTVNIAIGVLSTVEEILGSVHRMYNIFVDGRKVGRIQFSSRASQQGGYVILAYDGCASIDNVYSKMKKGKQVSFISDDDQSRFDFALDDLSNAEGLFKGF